MVKIQFLTILLTVTCFLGGVVSVADKEYEVCNVHNKKQLFRSVQAINQNSLNPASRLFLLPNIVPCCCRLC